MEHQSRKAEYIVGNIEVKQGSFKKGLYKYLCIGLCKNVNPCNRLYTVDKNKCKIHNHVCPPPKPPNKPIQTNNNNIPKKRKPRPSTRQKPRKDTFVFSDKHDNSFMYCQDGVLIPSINSSDNNNSKYVAVRKPTRHISWKYYKYRVNNYARSFWETKRTLPVDDFPATTANLQLPKIQPLIIDLHKEIIRSNVTPPILYIRFAELTIAFNSYCNIDRVRHPCVINQNRYNIVNVAYYLQWIVVFLEGLNELAKLSAIDTNVNVILLKNRMLLFMNYDPNVCLNANIPTWLVISNQIREELLYILEEIFDKICGL